jgi:hypothetical protein
MKTKKDTLRIVREASVELDAGAKTVFPLLCPVKEVDWIDGWEDICTLVYTDSGIAEEACVFETDIPLEGKALWICSRYDAAHTRIEYIKHIIGKAVIKWAMDVRDLPGGRSEIYARYNATSLSEEGRALVKDLGETGFLKLMDNIRDEINYYISNGKMKKNFIQKAACHIQGHLAGKEE